MPSQIVAATQTYPTLAPNQATAAPSSVPVVVSHADSYLDMLAVDADAIRNSPKVCSEFYALDVSCAAAQAQGRILSPLPGMLLSLAALAGTSTLTGAAFAVGGMASYVARIVRACSPVERATRRFHNELKAHAEHDHQVCITRDGTSQHASFRDRAC